MIIYPIKNPGGSNTHYQYNKGGIFGGSAHSVLNDATGVSTFTGVTVTNCTVLGSNSSAFKPNADQTDFFQILAAAGGTAIFQVDTTNKVIGINTAPNVNSDIAISSTHSSAAADQFGINGILIQDTATAYRAVGIRAGSKTTHAAGTISTLIGFETVCAPSSGGAVTSAYGALLGAGVEPGQTPAITVLAGAVGQTAVGDAAVTFAIDFYSLGTNKIGGTVVSAIGFYAADQTVGTTQNLSFLSQGDMGVATNKKLYLEATIGGTGDTYLTYDSVGATLDCFVNATEVWNANTTTFTVPVIGHFGGAANYTQFAVDGDLHFVGTAGLQYGEQYLQEGTQNIDISTAGADTYVQITGLTAGQMHGCSDESDAINIAVIGRYLVNWSCSFSADAGEKERFHFALFNNGAEMSNGSAQVFFMKAFGEDGEVQCASGTAILDIVTADHNIDLRVKNISDNNDITVRDCTITVVQIGGT